MYSDTGSYAPLFMENYQHSPGGRSKKHDCSCDNCGCQGSSDSQHFAEEKTDTVDLLEDIVEDMDGGEDSGEELDLEALQQELQRLQEQEAELTQRLTRLQADFDNFRKRSRKEMQESIIRANEELIGELLPVLDNFDRALVVEENASAESIRNGMELIYRQLLDILGKEGLVPIGADGELFDPHKHDAVLVESIDDPVMDNRVIQELKKGYSFRDRVLRAAVVKVAKLQD